MIITEEIDFKYIKGFFYSSCSFFLQLVWAMLSACVCVFFCVYLHSCVCAYNMYIKNTTMYKSCHNKLTCILFFP